MLATLPTTNHSLLVMPDQVYVLDKTCEKFTSFQNDPLQ